MGRLITSLLFLSCVGLTYGQPAPRPVLLAESGSIGAVPTSTTEIAPSVVAPHRSPDIPPLPSGKTTVIGGVVRSVDHMRDQLTLDIFGGGRAKLMFDERTHVLAGTASSSVDDLKPGARVSIDTNLDGKNIFARNIRVNADLLSGNSEGQITGFDSANGELLVRDSLSSTSSKMRLAPGAVISRDGQTATSSELRDGALVSLVFQASNDGKPLVRKVTILAEPGATFFFSGRVESVDLHRGLMTVVDPRDNKSYDVSFDQNTLTAFRNLKEGVTVNVQAIFDGRQYRVRTATVNPGVTE